MAQLGQIVHYIPIQYPWLKTLDTDEPVTEYAAAVSRTRDNGNVDLHTLHGPTLLKPYAEHLADVPYSQTKEPRTWHFVED